MKKWYILLFSILLLLGFVACGKNSASGMAADSQAADQSILSDDHPGKSERTYGYPGGPDSGCAGAERV